MYSSDSSDDAPIRSISPVAPLAAERRGDEVVIRLDGLEPRWIRLLSSTSVAVDGAFKLAWSWEGVVPRVGGGWDTIEDGPTGDEFSGPAFEIGTLALAAVNDVVLAYPGAGANLNGTTGSTENDWGFEWYFAPPAKSPTSFDLTAADDKANSYTGRDKLTFDRATISDDGSGDSTITPDDADATHPGDVNLTNGQQLGDGGKKVNGILDCTQLLRIHQSALTDPSTLVGPSYIEWNASAPSGTEGARIQLTDFSTYIRASFNNVGAYTELRLAVNDTEGVTGSGPDVLSGLIVTKPNLGKFMRDDVTWATISITSASVSDFTEAAQDVVGGCLVDSTTINLTYDDAANTITADAIYQQSITADASGLKLSGDSASPGNSYYYGTDSGGTKGWYSLPSGYTDEEAQDAVGTILVDSATIDFTYNDATPSITADVIDDSISNAKLRNSGACSVIGRSANSTGDPADISAGSNDTLLIRTSNTLSFGQLTVGMVPDDLVTYAKIQNVSATQRVLARKTAGAGDVEECTTSEVLNFIASVADGDILYRTGGAWTRLAVGTRGQQIEVNGSTLPAWSGPHAARVYHSVNQTISNSTVTALALDSERFDTDSFHDTSTNNSRLTVPSGMGGKYLIGGSIQWDAATGGYRFLGLRLNGSTYLSVQSIAPNPTAATEQSLSTLYNLSAGDYVELIAFQNRGGNLNVNAAGNNSPEFWLVWMGP